MAGIAALLYGAIVYLIFLGTFLYAIAFVGNLPVPKTIDSGEPSPLLTALIVNTLCLTLFAMQHSVMARPAFKSWWTRLVPQSVERSTYVLFASAALLLLYWQWRPLPAPVWSVTDPVAVLVLQAISWLGWAIVLISTFLISHFELFGLRQVYARLRASRAACAGIQDAVPVQAGSASDLSWFSAGLLGNASHDGRPPAVCHCHHRLYLARHLSRGAGFA